MKVYLNFGARSTHHSLYDELLSSPPDGVQYITHGLDTKKLPIINSAYQAVRGVAGHIIRPLVRKTILATAPKVDLVHFCDNIADSKTPFVADFEHAWSLLPYVKTLSKEVFDQGRETVQGRIKQKTCKLLLPWTKKSGDSVVNAFGFPGIEDKMVVVPLAIRVPPNHQPLEHNGFNLLFLGTSNLKGDWNFYYRGGVRMLRVFRRFCSGKKDVKLVITGELPAHERWRIKGLPAVEAGMLPKKELEAAFRSSDALFYPSYSTPGMAFLEAMSHHLPVITTDSWANPEIVSNGKTGWVCGFTKFKKEGPYGILPLADDYIPFEKKEVDEALEDSLLEALEKLYADRKLARRLGENGFKGVSEGKFSIKTRNALLLKAYSRALE